MGNTARAVLAALFFGHVATAAAENRHDERLAAAAAAIAVAKLGGLRGGLPDDGASVNTQPAMSGSTTNPRPRSDDLRPGVWTDGLAIAVEARSSASPEL